MLDLAVVISLGNNLVAELAATYGTSNDRTEIFELFIFMKLNLCNYSLSSEKHL